MVGYVSDAGQDGAAPQVWVQQVGGAAVQLTRDMRECAEPSFTPDGTRVIFSAVVDSTRHVYQIPALGGTPQILKRAARNARYSPDGRWLLYHASPLDNLKDCRDDDDASSLGNLIGAMVVGEA
jgi:Tol biopolymer transport system component